MLLNIQHSRFICYKHLSNFFIEFNCQSSTRNTYMFYLRHEHKLSLNRNFFKLVKKIYLIPTIFLIFKAIYNFFIYFKERSFTLNQKKNLLGRGQGFNFLCSAPLKILFFWSLFLERLLWPKINIFITST